MFSGHSNVALIVPSSLVVAVIFIMLTLPCARSNLVVAVIFISYERGIQSQDKKEDDFASMLALLGASPKEVDPGAVGREGDTDGDAALKVERSASSTVAPLLYGTPTLPIPSECDVGAVNFGAKPVAEGMEDEHPLQRNLEAQVRKGTCPAISVFSPSGRSTRSRSADSSSGDPCEAAQEPTTATSAANLQGPAGATQAMELHQAWPLHGSEETAHSGGSYEVAQALTGATRAAELEAWPSHASEATGVARVQHARPAQGSEEATSRGARQSLHHSSEAAQEPTGATRAAKLQEAWPSQKSEARPSHASETTGVAKLQESLPLQDSEEATSCGARQSLHHSSEAAQEPTRATRAAKLHEAWPSQKLEAWPSHASEATGVAKPQAALSPQGSGKAAECGVGQSLQHNSSSNRGGSFESSHHHRRNSSPCNSARSSQHSSTSPRQCSGSSNSSQRGHAAPIKGGWISPTLTPENAAAERDAGAALATAATGKAAPPPNSPMLHAPSVPASHHLTETALRSGTPAQSPLACVPSVQVSHNLTDTALRPGTPAQSPLAHAPSEPASHHLTETAPRPGTPAQLPLARTPSEPTSLLLTTAPPPHSPAPPPSHLLRVPSNPTAFPSIHQHKPAARRHSEPYAAFLARQGSTPTKRASVAGYGRTSSVTGYSRTSSLATPGKMHKRASTGNLRYLGDLGDSGKGLPRRNRRRSSIVVQLASHNYRPYGHTSSLSSQYATVGPFSRQMSSTGGSLGRVVSQEGLPCRPESAVSRPQSLPEFPDDADLLDNKSEEDDGLAVEKSTQSQSAPELYAWRDSNQRLSAIQLSGDRDVQKCISTHEPIKELSSTKEESMARPSASQESLWESLRAFGNKVIDSRNFELFTCTVIAANAIILGLNWYFMPEPLERAVYILNYAFTCYFVVEITLRVSVKGRDFFTSRMNW
ncbi:hypothetical protein DUNSADRAFT_12971 [Dunaliella salina]|uniref:Ion transport domain-containing protein n=1 Tax=Dunaliella salina TaxID=3046 RepID=A0ABQ7GAC2_DUNSA|nr:hypothetical protein DUNSADRAFT_12971 [Dunaliella salina]|eukprot:KAF5831558.1 hypothetical protein DUNSADRAFT_12971 [Dunaliella salina]